MQKIFHRQSSYIVCDKWNKMNVAPSVSLLEGARREIFVNNKWDVPFITSNIHS